MNDSLKEKISNSVAIIIALSFIIFIVAMSWINEVENDSFRNIIPKHGNLPAQTDEKQFKMVEFRSNEAVFTFLVPDDWMAETRNSGDKIMNEQEMRNFLATNINSRGQNYSDMTDEELARLSSEDLEREIQDFPNATVAKVGEKGGIDYSDWNPDQIDISLVDTRSSEDEKEGIRLDAKNFLANNPYQHTFKWIWSMENVNGYEAETVTFPLGLDSAGYKNATVELTGGKIYFISLDDAGKTLIIKKQGKGDEQFERDFDRMIESIRFYNEFPEVMPHAQST